MNKLLRSLLALTLAAGMLAGCSGGNEAAPGNSESKPTTETTTSTSGAAAKEEQIKIDANETEGEATTEQVDKVVIAINSASTDASPYAMNTPSRGATKEPLYATLFYVEPMHFIEDVQPYIGKTLTQVDDFTWDIELFDNAVDSKGNPIKAQDVLWSYEHSFRNQEFFVYGTDVDSLTVVDDTHLRLVVNKTIPGVIEKLVCSNPLTIVNQNWYENASDEEKQMDPATTGRFTVETNVSGSELVLLAKENYWKDEADCCDIEKANVKRLDLKVITEDSMRAIALENKEVDSARVTATNLHRFYNLDTGEAVGDYNVFLGMYGSPGGVSMFCNMDPNGGSPLSKDVNLRKAALYGVSSEDFMLASGNTNKTAVLSNGFGSVYSAGYQEAWDDPSNDYWKDSSKAHEFYAASGHKDGEVEITVLMSISLFNDSQQAVVIAGLTEAGFKVNLLAVDQALFLNYRFESDQWDIIFDYKGSGDHIVSGWDNLFNPVSYSNGSVCFTHDDHLVELLEAAVRNTNDDTVNAFNDYINEQAICKYTYTGASIQITQNGVLKPYLSNSGFCGQASTYSVDYVSAAGAAKN